MTAPLSLVPPVVAATIERSYGHHRTPWFEEILARTAASLAGALGPRTPLMLTATALGAREAVVANTVVPGQAVWTSPAGDFAALVTAWQARPLPIDGEPEAIARAGGRSPLVLLEHVDATGAVLDLATTVAGIRAAAPDALIVVDASVSFGADLASFDGLDVDAALIAPEGALMGIPGLAIVAANERLLDHVRTCRNDLGERPFYFDLLRYETQWRKRTTPFSPNISATVALCKSLELIEANGGLERHVARHAARAASLRQALESCGVTPLLPAGRATNAFTIAMLPEGADLDAVIHSAGLEHVHVDRARASGSRRIRVDHTGYLPPGALSKLAGRLRSACATAPREASAPVIAELELSRPVPANIPPDEALSIFAIPPDAFAAQARLHARRVRGGARFEQRIDEAVRDVFRHPHRYEQRTLQSRTIGFVGAGNITRHAVEKCREVGIRSLIVYSPSLSDGGRGSGADDPKGVEYWTTRGVVVAGSAEEIFRQAHTIVLLPWFYDREALDAFGKSESYLNEGLISAEVLAMIEREGCADLLINAAAREGLVDRRALAAAVSAGWLRYASDELPDPADPLLELREARFTAHVGGSCAAPQAAVARNTHRILRQLARLLVDGVELAAAPDQDYRINLVNRDMERSVPWRTPTDLRDGAGAAIRVLITDPFDVPSLDFDGVRKDGYPIEVLDVSAEQASGAALEKHLRAFRPHVWMLRSRTKVDKRLAEALRDVPELFAIVRPGVGIDNLYGGLRELTGLGIRIINEPYGNSSAVAEMTLHFILSAAGETLLAPGPTPFRAEVFEVMSEYGHPARPAFRDAYAGVCRRVADWFVTTSDTVVLSGSGTGLMEAGVVSLSAAGDRGLVISHGKFGDRFVDIAQARRRAVDVLRVDEPDWGRAISPAEVRERLEAIGRSGGRVAFLCLQQNETSSGVTYHAPQLGEIVRAARAHDPEVMVIVDAISGAFAHAIEFEALDVDLLITGSQKGLGVSSGLAYGVVSTRALARMLRLAGFTGSVDEWIRDERAEAIVEQFERRQKVRYLGLLRMVLEHRRATFHDVPSVFHVLSSLRALQLHDEDGGREAVLARHAEMATLVRRDLAGAGLRPVSGPPYHSDSVTPAFVADGIAAPELRKQLQAFYGIAVAGAQGDYWKAQMIRIGHLGFVYAGDLARCLRGLRILQGRMATAGSPPLDAPTIAV